MAKRKYWINCIYNGKKMLISRSIYLLMANKDYMLQKYHALNADNNNVFTENTRNTEEYEEISRNMGEI